MAWSLTNDERAQVRAAFQQIDQDNTGTITLLEMKSALAQKMQVTDSHIQQIFNSFESHHGERSEVVNYSDFLAAMMAQRIQIHDDLLISTFKRFDVNSSGYITAADLAHLLGDTYKKSEVERLMTEADISGDGQISEEEFVKYLRGGDLTEG